MNEIKEYAKKVFEDIKHIDENGKEYWLARELMPMLEYVRWQKFINAVEGESIAIKTHYEVGKEIRNTIKKLGGTMPRK